MIIKGIKMKVHPKSRKIFFKLPLIGPLKKYLSGMEIDTDLSNNTNPFLGSLANYPDLIQTSLKEVYWKLINSINRPSYYSQQDSSNITPDNILFTVGSSEGIDLLLRAFAEPGQDVIAVTDPSFPAYEHWGLIHNLQVKKFGLSGENYNQLDVTDIIRENPKLVFLCHPNNPTGTLLSQEVIYQLCDSVDGFVIVDEAYIEFSEAPSLIYDLSRFKNLIVLRTLSKAWGLAGIRCGVVIAADPLVINTLRYIQVPFGFSTPSQEIFAKRCALPEEMVNSWEQVRKEREKLSKKLQALNIIQKVIPTHTNFLLVEFNSFSKVMDILSQHKIHVVDCSNVIPNSVRISIGNLQENQKLLDVLQSI